MARAPPQHSPPPPPMCHFALRWFPYGALDSHPVFPLQSASGRCWSLGRGAGACCFLLGVRGTQHVVSCGGGWCCGGLSCDVFLTAPWAVTLAPLHEVVRGIVAC